jgi:S-adenosylmethionine:tRNA ribosyltransferase-isomerase
VLTSEFAYELPESAIAQSPASPRDSARLLATRDLSDHLFRQLPDLLNPGDLVVVNETRVRAARIHGHKHPTGGAVEVLLLTPEPGGMWQALIRPSRRIRPGVEVRADDLRMTVVTPPADGLVRVSLEAPGDIESAIEAVGEVPLPPYITTKLADPSRYQTMFAQTTGSAAAPTAGLHFTPAVVHALKRRQIELARVELRVGLDTFRPISTDCIEDHAMHSEWVRIPPETARSVANARSRGGAVVAIGTTVVRTLESRHNGNGVEPGSGGTDLFIRPGHKWGVVDRLITNFHMPGSSLIVLVAAFMGPSWRTTYRTALERGYRFLSFGDAMLADRADP